MQKLVDYKTSRLKDADEKLLKIEEYNSQIDTIYDTIQVLREEKFPIEQELLNFEREVGYTVYCRGHLWSRRVCQVS